LKRKRKICPLPPNFLIFVPNDFRDAVADPQILKGGDNLPAPSVLIYRKCAQRNKCLLHKKRLFEKQWANRGAAPPLHRTPLESATAVAHFALPWQAFGCPCLQIKEETADTDTWVGVASGVKDERWPDPIVVRLVFGLYADSPVVGGRQQPRVEVPADLFHSSPARPRRAVERRPMSFHQRVRPWRHLYTSPWQRHRGNRTAAAARH